jgi:hypothetical protein
LWVLSRRTTASNEQKEKQDEVDDDSDDGGEIDVATGAAGVLMSIADWDGWLYAARWPLREPGDASHWARVFVPGRHAVRRRCLKRTFMDGAVERKRELLVRRQLKEEEQLRHELSL